MKNQLRKAFFEKRESLSTAAYWDLNDRLLQELAKIDWSKFQYIHIFLPIKERKEIDTFEIISFFRQHFPNVNLVVPKTDFLNKTMEHIRFDHEHTILQKNKYHIPEPVFGDSIPNELIDAVFVPLLIFDETGNRIGYGGGFYDRFLAKCRKETFKVGLSLFDPILDHIEKDPFDVKLDACITPHQIFYF